MTQLVDIVLKIRIETEENEPAEALYDAEELVRRQLDRPSPRTTAAEIRSYEFVLAHPSDD